MKKFLFSISAIILFVLIFFMIGEICFRIFGGEYNPLASTVQNTSAYLFKPNSVDHSKSSVEGEFDYIAHRNKFGYRGKDFLMPKPKGVFRIFAVGDSFTYGVGSEDNQTIPALVEAKLRERNPNLEIINAGVGHASTIKHYINFKKIHLPYQPDMVIYFFDFTDLWDDWNFEKHAVYDKNGEIIDYNPMLIYGKRDWWITAVNYSAFCNWINRKIVRSIQKINKLGIKNYVEVIKKGKRAKAAIINADKNQSDQAILEYDALLMLRGRERKELIDENWKRTALYLTKIKKLLDDRNIPMMIVVYPHGIYVGKDQWDRGRETWGFERGKVYTDYYPFELLESFAKEKHIPFVNCLNDFLKAPPKPYFFAWDGHLNSEGNKIIANSIVNSRAFNLFYDEYIRRYPTQ